MKKLMFALSCFAIVMGFSRSVHAGENVKQCYMRPATERSSRDRVISDREDRRERPSDSSHSSEKKN